MTDVLYTDTNFHDYWCHKHDHLASQRDCDYTLDPANGLNLGQLTPVNTTITATVREPDYDDYT